MVFVEELCQEWVMGWFLTICVVLPWLWAISLSGADRSRIAEGCVPICMVVGKLFA